MADYPNDHDLLVTLHEQVKQIREDIRALQSNTANRIDKLEVHKMDSKDFVEWAKMIHDHETRLRIMERYVAIAVGALVIVQLLITYYLKN